MRRAWRGAAVALLLGGCATSAINENYDAASAFAKDRLGVDPRWLATDEERQQAASDTEALLAKPLGANDAVRIALGHSPAVQAVLFESAAGSASATQSARLPNPIFAFERLLRTEGGVRELEITRSLAVSIFDVLLLPSRLRLADYQQQQLRLRMSSDLVQAASDARQTWVRAVAAQQSVGYFEQVKAAADAGAELARRMQAAGNFNRLRRAREQAFSAEAVAQLARARQNAQSTREALVRVLGLDDAQAAALKLPERLPDLPAAPHDEKTTAQKALEQRLDVRMAKGNLEFTAREQGLTRVTSIVNGLHLGAVDNKETGRATQRGYELELPLPIFDFGDTLRARAQATYMAALNRTGQVAIDASSQVRESYSSYRTAYDLARHYRDEIVPLRKTIAEENMLRYNGMLIGVFELLADAREQIGSVVQAIDAQRDFWLADAALQAALIGRPMGSVALESGGAGKASAQRSH
ncbi:MAG: TolC family protein [Pseudomonadota bacterium]|nr:TolC family protein [Pseudomonadota bacterium]